MKEYTIQEELRKVLDLLEDLRTNISNLEDKVKRAKLYPQLLSDEVWCETPKGEK
jgi:hypothetical protein